MLSRRLILGLVLTIILAALALFVGEYLRWLSWIALLPVLVAWYWERHTTLQSLLTRQGSQLATKSKQAEIQSDEMQNVSTALHVANEALQLQVETLTNIRNATLAMSATLDQEDLLNNVIDLITSQLNFDRAILLLTNTEQQALTFGAISHPATSTEAQFRLEHLALPLSAKEEFGPLNHWSRGRSVLQTDVSQIYGKPFGWIFALLELETFFSVPLTVGDNLLGVIIVDNCFTNTPFSEESKSLLEALGTSIAMALQNTHLYQLTDEQLNRHVKELDMMRQVDRELMEALSWDRVLNMTLDWALRLTGAHSASLATVDAHKENLQVVAGYGLDLSSEKINNQPLAFEDSFMGKVARTGSPVIVNDVQEHYDQTLSQETKSCLAVSIRRYNRVIAVLKLESTHLNYFKPEHLDFAERLANRASVALDNARLFDETQREREKLSSIVARTADVIIVVGFDRRLILLNDAAIATFRLNPHIDYAGQAFDKVFAFTPLAELGQRTLAAPDKGINLVEEITLEEDRYFHTHTSSNEQVGWMIVMHDVTPFKETEQLKNELIATVSHDLKNPLSVINGYVELLDMSNDLNERGLEFMKMIRRSILTMRQLIDDLLDLAHIDAGLDIQTNDLNISAVLEEAVMSLINLADEKRQDVALNVPENLPLITGDEKRLRQIIVNLVSNAIKYTPPQGQVTIAAEPRDDAIIISIKDTGLGISPEDQAQIFERFFRVRRPETDGIEGTGLGLAIVKSLVEAHGGEIGIESRLGEGSTFYFTVPVSTVQYNNAHTPEPLPLPQTGD
ncbi:ATP-binding protein [Chloroflexota bacterium]